MSETEAWLFRCWQPGKSCQYATVDKDDNSWWNEGWQTVIRVPLVAEGAGETIHDSRVPPHDVRHR